MSDTDKTADAPEATVAEQTPAPAPARPSYEDRLEADYFAMAKDRLIRVPDRKKAAEAMKKGIDRAVAAWAAQKKSAAKNRRLAAKAAETAARRIQGLPPQHIESNESVQADTSDDPGQGES